MTAPQLICTCGEVLTRKFNGGRDNPLFVTPCEKCQRNLRALLTQHRRVIQALKHRLDQLVGVAASAPQDIRDTFDFEWLETLMQEADRVLMLSEEEVGDE